MTDGAKQKVVCRNARQSQFAFSPNVLADLGVLLYHRYLDASHWHLVNARRWRRLTGYGPSDLSTDDDWLAIVHPADRELVESAFRQVRARGLYLTYRIVTRSGRTVWLRDRAVLVSGDSSHDRVDGAVSDVTSEMSAEEHTHDSELRFRSVFDNASVGVALLDAEGLTISANDALGRFLGVGASTDPDPGVLLRADDLRAAVSSYAKNGSPEDRASRHVFEASFPRLDGTHVWGRVNTCPVYDQGGSLKYIVAVCENITDIKMAKEAQEESERLLRSILDSLPSFVCIFEADSHQLSYVNKAARDQLGLPRRGQGLSYGLLDSYVHFMDRDKLNTFCERLRAMSTETEAETEACAELRFWNTKERWSFMDARAMIFTRCPDGSPKDYLLAALDVTDQREAQERIESYQESLRRLASESALAAERERQRVAIALHDNVGQVLAMARMKLRDTAKTIVGDTTREATDEVVDLMEQAIQQTRHLTHELSPPVLREHGLEAAVSWLCAQMRRQLGIAVELRLPSSPLPLTPEAAIVLYQAVRELLSNVIKHAGTDSATVSIAERDGVVEIKVEDRGRGFDPPLQSKNADNDCFGLFSVRERVSYVGGDFRLTSQSGKGTSVLLTIPLNCG